MEPKGLLPCLQQPATGAYHESDESSSNLPTHSSKIHSNIILPCGLFPSGLPITCPAYLILLGMITIISCEEYKLCSSSLWNVSPAFHYVLHLRSEYLSKDPLLTHLQSVFLL